MTLSESQDPVPQTIGGLRRRLAELDNPWQVDPTLSDDEPLPDPPRGGAEPPVGLAERLARSQPAAQTEADIDALIAQQVPANPDLRGRWVDAGLLEPTGGKP